MQVQGSVALVAGGAGGLGEGAARKLVERGAKVALLDLETSSGDEVARRLGSDTVFIPVDVTDTESVEHAVASVVSTFGRVDVCVNAAGIIAGHRVVGRDGTLFPMDRFRAVIDVNLVGLFDVMRRAAEAMSRNEPNQDGERGVVVNVASIAAYEGQIGQAAYSASKGGIVALTLPVARDLASRGIRVMAIAPGIMDTPMLGAVNDDVRASLASVHVFPKRLGTPADLGSLVVAIVENPLLNGEVIRLDAAARLGPR
jgi:3-hydroxyacyl-CoA dehydrogenase / 3-hydroxy-2-methylbutyryl-CoA dehydrogenase